MEINWSSRGKLEKQYSFNKPSSNMTEKIKPRNAEAPGATMETPVTLLSLTCLR